MQKLLDKSREISTPELLHNKKIAKDLETSLSKERQACFRIVIKKRIQEKGALEALKSLTLPPDSEEAIMLTEYDNIEEQRGFSSNLSSEKTYALFVTFSPEPGLLTTPQMDMLLKKVFMKDKKGITQVIWNIENYGQKSEHIHSHILILLDKTNQAAERAKMKRWLEGKFKVYRTKTDAYLQVKAVSQPKYQDKLDYVMGKKRDKEKAENVEKDKIWRRDNDLPDYYVYPKD